MTSDTAVAGDIICTVRLSITPGDEMLSIKGKTNVFFFFFFCFFFFFATFS